MKVAQQALAIARIQAGRGGVDSTLDPKTSVLLRFNAIVVAALAYVVVISASEPFMGTSPPSSWRAR